MKPLNRLFLCLLTVLLFVACDDILEPEINKERVVILSPSDSTVISSNEVVFSWEPVAGAGLYHVQIFQPNFAAAGNLIMDTLMFDSLGQRTYFKAHLEVGQYEWRIRAENTAYVTDYSYSAFRVDTSENLANYQVVLQEPETGARFNTREKVSFIWEPLNMADFYVFRLEGADTLININTSQTSLEVNFFTARNDHTYDVRWNVLAVDEEGGNAGSAEGNFILDLQAPAVPAAVQPGDASSFSSGIPITFEWEETLEEDFEKFIFSVYNNNDPGTAVFTNELMGTFIEVPGPVENQSFDPGNYSWGIQTVDKLGNISPLGNRLGSFTVTEGL